jgi:hypothetical protein
MAATSRVYRTLLVIGWSAPEGAAARISAAAKSH